MGVISPKARKRALVPNSVSATPVLPQCSMCWRRRMAIRFPPTIVINSLPTTMVTRRRTGSARRPEMAAPRDGDSPRSLSTRQGRRLNREISEMEKKAEMQSSTARMAS